MELAWICAQQVAVLFLLIGAGALGVKMGWLKAEGRQMLSSLLVNLVVRALPSKYTEFDLSEGKMYTLGDSSVQLAQSLQQDVTIYYLCETGSEDAIITKLLDQPYPLGAEGPDPLPDLCGAVRGRKCIHRKPDRDQRGGQRGAGCRRSVRV